MQQLTDPHLTSPDGRAIGDIQGIYHDGVYHVYYLLNASGNEGVQWEHAWTRDLVTWRHAPPAISREPGDPWALDSGNVFTGCLLTDPAGLHHAWYTAWSLENHNGREFIRHATSRDLFSFDKHPSDTLSPHPAHYSASRHRDFRDPCVVYDSERKLYDMFMLANPASGENAPDLSSDNWVIGHMESEDLVHWRALPPMDAEYGDECPDYHQIGPWHYLLTCRGYQRAAQRFGPYRADPVSGMEGPFAHAGKAIPDGDRLLWMGGWMNGAMSLPREVFAGKQGALLMRPAREIVDHYREPFASGQAQDAAIVPLPPNPNRLRLVVSGPDPLRFSLQWQDGRLTLDADARQMVVTTPGGITTRHTFAFGPTALLDLYVTDNWVELFMDDRLAFTFEATRQRHLTQLQLEGGGAHFDWQVLIPTPREEA